MSCWEISFTPLSFIIRQFPDGFARTGAGVRFILRSELLVLVVPGENGTSRSTCRDGTVLEQ